MNLYRIDKSTESVFEYSSKHNAYMFLCSFFQIGANRKNREATIIRKVEDWVCAER